MTPRTWDRFSTAVPTALLALALAASAGAQMLSGNLLYSTVQPCRLVDTRLAGGAIQPGSANRRAFNVVGVASPGSLNGQGGNANGCPIPGFDSFPEPQVQAVMLNLTAVTPSGAGDLRAWPSDHAAPTASALNYSNVSGLNIANGIVVPVRQDVQGADITVQADVSATHLVIDVVGYFSSSSAVQGAGIGNLFIGAQRAGNQSVTTGSWNTAIGLAALTLSTSGSNNTAVGANALLLDTTASENTAVGYSALASFTDVGNTAVGFQALNANTSNYSTGLGWNALQHSTGTRNTAVGAGALQNLASASSTENVAVGVNAGLNYTGGEYGNVIIGGDLHGTTGDKYVTRIGTPDPAPCLGTGDPNCAGTYISHIWGATAGGSFPIAVYVDTDGHLGTDTSARRFKEDIEDMGDASSDLMRLRPVTFHFKRDHDDPSRVLQFGLIAEEVADVYPELVAYQRDGQALTVRYHVLVPMLLNEVQKAHRLAEEREARLAALTAQVETADRARAEQDVRIAAQQAQIAAQESRLRQLEDLLQRASMPAPSGGGSH